MTAPTQYHQPSLSALVEAVHLDKQPPLLQIRVPKIPKHNRQLAFTLVELLTCIALIMVLCGILFPVLVQAKRAAKQSVELSNLNQIGIAATLYLEETGAQPLGTPCLIPAKIPAVLAYSTSDPTRVGFANLEVREISNGLPSVAKRETAYPRTYIGFYDFGWDLQKWADCTTETTNTGWLISLTPAKYDPRFPLARMRGSYHRLQLDGSVRDYQLRLIDTPSGRAWWPVSFFVDVNDLNAWNRLHPKCSLQ